MLQKEPAGTMLPSVSRAARGRASSTNSTPCTRRADDDIVIEKSGATVLIDPVSLNYMAGSEIDFVDDLIGSAFKVNNPQATASGGAVRASPFSTKHVAPVRIATWKRQFHEAAHRLRARLACRAQARHRLPAGNQKRRRCVPARRVRVARHRRRRPRPEDLQRRGAMCAISVRRGHTTACPGRRPDHARFIGSGGVDGGGRAAVAAPTLPNGTAETEKYSYKIGPDGSAIRIHPRVARLEERLVMAGDYNVIPTSADARNPQPGPATRCILPKTLTNSRAGESRSHRRGARDQRDRRASIRSRNQAGAWQQTTASARPPPSPLAADRLTDAGIDRHVGPGENRPITCRCGSTWISRRSSASGWRNNESDVRRHSLLTIREIFLSRRPLSQPSSTTSAIARSSSLARRKASS